MERELSLIIPAYNEVARLPAYLARVRRYLQSAFKHYEVIVVDDGSEDGLGRPLESCAHGWVELSYVRHAENLGKGAAVRTGMLKARGNLLLFADADGATPIEEERMLRVAIEEGADVAVGSRFLDAPFVCRDRIAYRGLLGQVFSWASRRIIDVAVQDSQCGFKMFRRGVGQRLFRLSREEGFLFDLEILGWARRLGYRIAEIPVNWADVPGSKVRLLGDGWRMLSGLSRVKRSVARQGHWPSASEGLYAVTPKTVMLP